MEQIRRVVQNLYTRNSFLLDSEVLEQEEKDFIIRVKKEVNVMSEVELSSALQRLSSYLSSYYGKNVLILLDEYDTPMQEAYINGYWDKMVSFIRNLFNSMFKTNPYMYRAVMTGITRVSKESIFSDFNNVEVVTTTSLNYMTAFGFTEAEVFCALEEEGLEDKKEEVKAWYDGFVFGNTKDVYNPWSILNFLRKEGKEVIWVIDMFLPCLGDRNMLKCGTVKCKFRIMFCRRCYNITKVLRKCYKKIKKYYKVLEIPILEDLGIPSQKEKK